MSRTGEVNWRAMKGLLFDKDGTLVDFAATWVPAFREAARRTAEAAGRPDAASRLLAEAGYDEASGSFEAGSMLASGTNREIVACWSAALGDAAPRDMERRIIEAFTEASRDGLVAAADMPRLFGWLANRGYRLGIATNDDTALAELAARQLGIRDRLCFVCGSDGSFGGKPGAGMGLAFCALTGLDPGEVAMVGDSAADAGMARAAGLGGAIGVLTGVAAREELEPWFDVVLGSIGDLPDLLDGRPSA